MKKFLLMAAVATTLVNCSSDFDLSEGQGDGAVSDVIGFQVQGRNSIKRGTLQDANHYNFGVFAYKSTDLVNNIMDNYLVGYLDLDFNKGYSTSGSTVGDQPSQVDGKSHWMYEGLGYDEFHGTYAGEVVNPGTKYASNVAKQYLRYWDKSAPTTNFYAYVPYLNATAARGTVSYVDGTAQGGASNTDTYVMTFPFGTIKHGYDDEQAYEYMYASTQVAEPNYGHDVQLQFKRLNAKVNIKFWEDIPGYSVHMIDLGNVASHDWTISAVPSIKEAGQGTYGYKLGKIYTENGVKIKFNTDATVNKIKQYEGATTDAPLEFKTPTAATIGESRIEATLSPTTYFAIPKYNTGAVLSNTAANINDNGTLEQKLAKTGLTFHVSYELISTTGEKITVKDATVHVPYNYCEWKENTRYTYIFKITQNSNGTTGSGTPDPTNPEVPTETALYPIVFDNCTVEEWKDNESEWEITDGTSNTWYDVKLSTYSFDNTGETKITVTVDRTSQNPSSPTETIKPAAGALAVTAPDGTTATFTIANDPVTNDAIITVPPRAATGKYTVTYRVQGDQDVNPSHPATYTENFYVGSVCDVQTNLPAVATNAEEAFTYLQIKTETNGEGLIDAPNGDNLSINYPINLTTAEKELVEVTADGKVKVAKAAKPGKYELVYTVSGSKPAVVKCDFEVKDYGLYLSKNAVELGASAVDVVASTGYTGANYTIFCNKTLGVTQSALPNNKTFSIANTAAEGTYTIELVVDNGDATSKATYKKTFTVANTYAVTVDKTTISRDKDRATNSEFGSDYIVISTLKNGVADNGREASLWVKAADGTNVTSSMFYISPISGNKYKLQVRGNTVSTPNGTYTIEFLGQAGKRVKTTFIVQD
ncbi:MAG: hypothetical protein SPE72_02530 [Alloprevotella sp.]|nr:hypothetical protein [Alloprevotella sp.]